MAEFDGSLRYREGRSLQEVQCDTEENRAEGTGGEGESDALAAGDEGEGGGGGAQEGGGGGEEEEGE